MRASLGASPLLRTHARVPYPYVLAFRQKFGADGQRRMLADLKSRALASGASSVECVMQDPTDGGKITLLNRGRFRSDEVMKLVGEQGVEEPPTWPVWNDGIAFSEPGLTDDEARAVAVALRSESSPRHLEGFAFTLDPYFPCAASLLRQRAFLQEPGACASPDGAPPHTPRDVGGFRRQLPSTGLPPELVNVEIKRAAGALSQGEQVTGSPKPIADLAAKTLRRTHVLCDGTKVFVVDPAAMLAAAPPTGREGFVSETALQLALAAAKPKVSGVMKFDRARSLYAELEAGNVPPEDRVQLLLARDMLDRARRALERRRWVEWYRKQVTT